MMPSKLSQLHNNGSKWKLKTVATKKPYLRKVFQAPCEWLLEWEEQDEEEAGAICVQFD